uniref:Uncharacterized protein n=1 Tax=Rhizophora mucronata TaxID=61149 RepID=A0A2P2NTS2_RHIMU
MSMPSPSTSPPSPPHSPPTNLETHSTQKSQPFPAEQDKGQERRKGMELVDWRQK